MNTNILYLTHNVAPENSAEAVNARRRKEVLEHLGYHVLWLKEQPSTIATYVELLKHIRTCGWFIIRIDGFGSLDKYSIIKLFFPKKKLIWEIHGHAHEKPRSWFYLKKRTAMRKLLSYFSSGYIYISKSLRSFSQRKLAVKKSAIIENFVTKTDVKISSNLREESQTPVFNKQSYCVVFWGGNSKYSWHATRRLEQVAHATYKRDPSILFIAIDPSPRQWNKNVMYFNETDRAGYLSLINEADICIALYQAPPRIPAYFSPMKILDYMLMHKPFIVSGHPLTRYDTKKRPAGIFLTKISVSQLVNAIALLKSNPAKRTRLAQNAQLHVSQEYSFSKAMNKYRNFFSKLKKENFLHHIRLS